ncbi:pyridoxamine 5'-phosphate oxidase family protein [Saccharomonospora sp. NB11]|jgi:hypothetical protein|uniref:pyridoxamine 5'-phosphate oxidase family protein n=1 Tax=Saccharomonospora sp. NB11 TaxID=1642298 RepID=UPI0018D12EDC|nr:pyridoxamine 5'-phosphate oxidase family protein [Saccharomonospora sp. NB11]
MSDDTLRRELDTPIAQELLRTTPLARLAYNGPDGFPRVVPVGFHWDGTRVVICTVPTAAKVAALRADPRVALTIDTETPRALLLRGTARIEIVDGVPDEYLWANRKTGEPAQWQAFEREVRALYERMAKIEVTPVWARALDFETTLPKAVEDLVRRKHEHSTTAG